MYHMTALLEDANQEIIDKLYLMRELKEHFISN